MFTKQFLEGLSLNQEVEQGGNVLQLISKRTTAKTTLYAFRNIRTSAIYLTNTFPDSDVSSVFRRAFLVSDKLSMCQIGLGVLFGVALVSALFNTFLGFAPTDVVINFFSYVWLIFDIALVLGAFLISKHEEVL